MHLDDPDKPEFASWNSYSRFARTVRESRRYVWDKSEQAFLDTVLATIRDRDGILVEGHTFFRAQGEVDWQDRTDDEGNWIGEDVWGCSAGRMKPLRDRAREGRANPSGIPVLYVASSLETAISEVRPWVGAEVSVARCRVSRPLKTLDLSLGHGKSSLISIGHLLDDKPLTSEEKEKAVWIEIDNAFSRPVTTSDDKGDYVPTQILAELFRSSGYDAIAYKSQFGEDRGYNIAIFDLEDVEITSCAPYSVNAIKLAFAQIGTPWTKATPQE